MSLRLVIKPRAQPEVDERIDSLDADTADRFVDELEHIFNRLLRFPHFGQLWDTAKPDHLAGVRRVVMPSFRVSVFYRPTDTTIEVLRVLHHAQEVPPPLHKDED